MNKLTIEKQYLTLSQSKELQALGIDFGSANFGIYNFYESLNDDEVTEIRPIDKIINDKLVTPTLSVTEMLEMLPDYIRIEHYIGKWNVGDYHNSIYPHNIDKVLLRDALFEMLKWLKQNKLI